VLLRGLATISPRKCLAGARLATTGLKGNKQLRLRFANKTFGDVDFSVSATGDFRLDGCFTATVSARLGTNVHLTGAGSCIIPRHKVVTRITIRHQRAAKLYYRQSKPDDPFSALANKKVGDPDFG